MFNSTRFTTLFVVLFALACGLAQAIRFDGGMTPQTIVPTSSTVAPGYWTTMTVSLNAAGTSPTTVYLSSSHPNLLQVPATVVVPANTISRQFNALAAEDMQNGFFQELATMTALGTVVTVTATANGQAVWTTITVL